MADKELFKIYFCPVSDEAEATIKQIDAWVEEDVAFGVMNKYDSLAPLNMESATKGLYVARSAADSLGIDISSAPASGVSYSGYSQVWMGTDLVSLDFKIVFMTDSDPIKDVRDKMKDLFKMSLPTKTKGAYMLKAPSLVSIVIPNVVTIPKAAITKVDFTQSRLLTKSNPGATAGPLYAEGTISVTLDKLMVAGDVDTIFK